MNDEDLSRWRPRWRINYAGYKAGNKRNELHREGRVIIHLGNEEYIGGFRIHRTGSVKLWSASGSFPVFFVKFQQCKFTKRREGNMNIYDVVVNAKFGENMNHVNNSTEKLDEKKGLDVLGKDDMIFIRNRHQAELDRDYDQIKRIVNYLKEKNNETLERKNRAEALEENIESHKKEEDRAFTTLQNLLLKEEKYENKMLDRTLKGMKANGRAIIKQKLKDVDIDSLQYGSVEQYKRLYPHYGDQIWNRRKEIVEKDAEIRKAEEAWREEANKYNYLVEIMGGNIQEAHNSVDKYEQTKKIGEVEIKSCRYYKSVFYKMSSKKTKTLLNLDTLKHDLNGLINDLNIIEKNYSAYKSRPLELISMAK
jgi:hypothetical protein